MARGVIKSVRKGVGNRVVKGGEREDREKGGGGGGKRR